MKFYQFIFVIVFVRIVNGAITIFLLLLHRITGGGTSKNVHTKTSATKTGYPDTNH